MLSGNLNSYFRKGAQTKMEHLGFIGEDDEEEQLDIETDRDSRG